jgi:hypothetical protein
VNDPYYWVFVAAFKIYLATTLAPLGIYFFTRKQQEPRTGYLAVMLIFAVLMDTIGLINMIWFHVGQRLNLLSNFYGLIETVTVILLYKDQLSFRKKWSFYVLAVVLVAAELVEMYVFRGPMVFPGTCRSILAIVVTIFALMYFYELMRDLPTVRIHHLPMFWINIGMLVFFTGNFFVFIMQDYLTRVMKDNMVFYWSFHNFMGILSNVFFSVGLLQVLRKEHSKVIQGMR